MTDLLAPLRSAGGRAYLGEQVTQAEHACQAAALAAEAGASPALVVAALLHDVGWLLPAPAGAPSPEAGDPEATDGNHAGRAALWLGVVLPGEVTGPVRLHVEAKRYLCATSPAYRRRLSPASVVTLARQGGAHRPEERVAFEADPWAEAAVALRRWDDDAKVPGRAVPGLEEWGAVLAGVLGE